MFTDEKSVTDAIGKIIFSRLNKRNTCTATTIKRNRFHRKRGTFSLTISRKGVIFYMLQHTCVPTFPMGVPAGNTTRKLTLWGLGT